MSSQNLIHPTAIIDPSAEIASDVQIGPYCIVGPNVTIDAGTKLRSHVVIGGFTKIGKNNDIFRAREVENFKYATFNRRAAMHTLAVIVGSLRKESMNKQLADNLARLGKDLFTFDFVNLADVPMLNQDLEADLPASVLRPGALACDLMYGPAAQGFLDWARQHGAVPRDGLGMLVEQAAEAFLLWRGVRPPSAQVLREMQQSATA